MTFQISYTDPLCDLSKDWNIIIIIIITQSNCFKLERNIDNHFSRQGDKQTVIKDVFKVLKLSSILFNITL